MNRKKYIMRRRSKFNSDWIHFQLGKMYYYGIDVEPDHKQALFHFKIAATNGNKQAALFLELLEQSPE